MCGQLTGPEAETLEKHVAECSHCNTVIDQFPGRDTLLDDIRAGRPLVGGQDHSVEENLRNRLRLLHPVAEGNATAVVAGQDRGSPGEMTQESFDFLAPPEGEGELGRLGGYRVLELLGSGGMGLVFRAEDMRLKRPVALKVIQPALAADAVARQRFLREAQAAARIDHEHIVAIHQVGEDRGVPFLAMPLLKGESLESRLEREGRLPVTEAVRIAAEMAEGLAAAHAAGLIHRDIKPANVWLETAPGSPAAFATGGRVKLLDFGLARTQDADSRVTQSGLIVGTPAFMAPEQARGAAIDGRADLFSLGCVLYLMLTGKQPFQGENTLDVLTALALHDPPSPQQLNDAVSPALGELTLRLLGKDPEQRPARAQEVAQALKDMADENVPPPAGRPAAALRRRKFLAAAAAGALLIAAVLVVIVMHLGGPEKGTVTIETVDPDVELVFTGGGRDYTVRDKKTGDEIKLPLGSYQVALKGGKKGLKLEADQFILKRGDRPLVKVTWQGGEKSAAAQENIPPPVEVPEPPPLAEWLKGRKVLTVAQDGSAQFKSIQAALNALEGHQVVKVLDRGPYRETLRLETVPEDTGLISERNTIVELPKWSPLPRDPNADIGHYFEAVDGFRLSGFCFLTPLPRQYCYVIRWDACPSGLVIEDCCFNPEEIPGPHPKAQSILLELGGPRLHVATAPIVIRRCAIYGGYLEIEGNRSRVAVYVENSYFRETGCISSGSGRLQKLIVRHNVFDNVLGGIWFQDLNEVSETLEISNNTFRVKHDPISIVHTAPKSGIVIRNNCSEGSIGLDDKAVVDVGDSFQNWHFDHNCYIHRGALPRAPSDVLDEPPFLSVDPSHPDYLRISADGPASRGGAGGAWPGYIGALPPGPAPKEGNWFTRLRQRWEDVPPAVKPPSSPVQVPEPSPLGIAPK
jgi:hypothetical protein